MKGWIRKNDLVWDEFGRGLLILNHRKGKVYTLNQTAKDIWKTLKTRKSTKEILLYLREKYKLENKDEKEVVRIIKNMKDLGLIIYQ